MAKIWTNVDTVICLSRKHCGKRRNCLLRAISPFPTMFSEAVLLMCLTITRRQILDWSKLKQSADDNFKFDENIRKFFKRVENNVGKEEISRYEQFLFFPQCF